MKFFRYRRPSWKTILGVTKAKKQIKKDLGITALLKPFRWLPNQKRRIKRKVGYESEVGRLVRDGLPKPGGCLVAMILRELGSQFCFVGFHRATEALAAEVLNVHIVELAASSAKALAGIREPLLRSLAVNLA